MDIRNSTFYAACILGLPVVFGAFVSDDVDTRDALENPAMRRERLLSEKFRRQRSLLDSIVESSLIKREPPRSFNEPDGKTIGLFVPAMHRCDEAKYKQWLQTHPEQELRSERQNNIEKALVMVHETFEELGMPTILEAGSLLGYFRNCGVIPSDAEGDVAVLARWLTHKRSLENLEAAFAKRNGVLSTDMCRNGPGSTGCELRASWPNSAYIDIFVYATEKECPVAPCSFFTSLRPNSGDGVSFYKCDVADVHFEQAFFLNKVFWIPTPTLRYLRQNYGNEWSEPGGGVYKTCHMHQMIKPSTDIYANYTPPARYVMHLSQDYLKHQVVRKLLSSRLLRQGLAGRNSTAIRHFGRRYRVHVGRVSRRGNRRSTDYSVYRSRTGNSRPALGDASSDSHTVRSDTTTSSTTTTSSSSTTSSQESRASSTMTPKKSAAAKKSGSDEKKKKKKKKGKAKKAKNTKAPKAKAKNLANKLAASNEQPKLTATAVQGVQAAKKKPQEVKPAIDEKLKTDAAANKEAAMMSASGKNAAKQKHQAKAKVKAKAKGKKKMLANEKAKITKEEKEKADKKLLEEKTKREKEEKDMKAEKDAKEKEELEKNEQAKKAAEALAEEKAKKSEEKGKDKASLSQARVARESHRHSRYHGHTNDEEYVEDRSRRFGHDMDDRLRREDDFRRHEDNTDKQDERREHSRRSHRWGHAGGGAAASFAAGVDRRERDDHAGWESGDWSNRRFHDHDRW
eukprot:TRINITY_DN602_c0_g1_i1.p1 TRINITY_DN602_c0_g1~~TRINITY_DN602_c0_g1_i1.p1  ORF type:complete len:739 (-),score=154.58 TRINITY_DN602_c0_g1_i1:177-2393(-)